MRSYSVCTDNKSVFTRSYIVCTEYLSVLKDLIPFARMINPFSRDLIPFARNLIFKNKTYVCLKDTTVISRRYGQADTITMRKILFEVFITSMHGSTKRG